MQDNKFGDIANIITNINLAMGDLIKQYSYLQLHEHSKETLTSSKKLLQSGQSLHKQLKSHSIILSEFINECEFLIEEIEDDLSHKRKKENFVFKTVNGMLSYPGRDSINKIKQPIVTKELNHTITIGNVQMTFPLVDNLNKIPPMFYYYKPTNTNNTSNTTNTSTSNTTTSNTNNTNISNTTNTTASNTNNTNNKLSRTNINEDQEGLYCCIGPNIYVQVPFPIIIDSSRDLNRDYSIKCKHKTRFICNDQRGKMAIYHNSIIRKCNFAHEGERILKIGYPSRCIVLPNVGNPETLEDDLKIIELDSIKNILLYGLNDVAIASMWFDKKKIKKFTLNNLDIA